MPHPTTDDFLSRLRQLIAVDDLPEALRQLQSLLKNSPKLNEVLLQSARLNEIGRQLRLALVSEQQAGLTKNQIRMGLLELIDELAASEADVPIRQALAAAIAVTNSKNVVTGPLEAGENIHLGDVVSYQQADKIYNIDRIGTANFS